MKLSLIFLGAVLATVSAKPLADATPEAESDSDAFYNIYNPTPIIASNPRYYSTNYLGYTPYALGSYGYGGLYGAYSGLYAGSYGLAGNPYHSVYSYAPQYIANAPAAAPAAVTVEAAPVAAPVEVKTIEPLPVSAPVETVAYTVPEVAPVATIAYTAPAVATQVVAEPSAIVPPIAPITYSIGAPIAEVQVQPEEPAVAVEAAAPAAPAVAAAVPAAVPAYSYHYQPLMYAPAYNPAPLGPITLNAITTAAAAAAPAAEVAAVPAVAAPAVVAATAPVVPSTVSVVPVAAGPIATQYHAQDEFGNLQYGYSNINSAKHEQGNAYTGVTGSYQYVDADGILQTVNYIADDFGFRVADSRLPIAPVHEVDAVAAPVAPVYAGVAPEPVAETPEVAAARAAHLAEVERILAESGHKVEKRDAESDPQVTYGYNYLPYKYGAGYYTPLLSYHNYAYPYVTGYGPRALSYHYRA